MIASSPEMGVGVYLPFACVGDTASMTVVIEQDVDVAETLGSSAWAAGHARELLADLPKRWAHTQEVARHARWAAAGVRDDDADLLVAAAFLHDIGYAEPIAHTGFHPLDGAVHLQGLGLGELARLVANHSGAHVEADHRGLAEELARFPRTHGPVSDALTYSDVTSGPTGQPMQPGDRFEEIVDRHGADSVVARSRAEARAELYGCVVRTLRRATRHQHPPTELGIGVVQLGCATLIRLQGRVDHSQVDRLWSTCAAVRDRRPHGLVVDLALVEAMDPAGAGVLCSLLLGAGSTQVTFLDPRARDQALLTHIAGRRLPVVFGPDAAVQVHCEEGLPHGR